MRIFFQIIDSNFNFVIDHIPLNGFVFLIIFEYVSLRPKCCGSYKLNASRFNSLFMTYLDRHAPLKKVKVTRPPVSLLKSDDIPFWVKIHVFFNFFQQSVQEYVLQKLHTPVRMIAFIFKQLTAVNTLISSVL